MSFSCVSPVKADNVDMSSSFLRRRDLVHVVDEQDQVVLPGHGVGVRRKEVARDNDRENEYYDGGEVFEMGDEVSERKEKKLHMI